MVKVSCYALGRFDFKSWLLETIEKELLRSTQIKIVYLMFKKLFKLKERDDFRENDSFLLLEVVHWKLFMVQTRGLKH